MSPSKSSLHSEEDEEFFDPHEVDANYSKNLSGTTSQINYPENFTNSSEVVLSSPDGVLSTSTTSEQIMKSPFHPKYTGQKKYSNNTPQNSNIVNLEPCVLREENPVVYNVTDVSLLENDGLVNQPIDKVENLLLAQISPLTLESSLEDLNIEKYKRSDYELDGISRACEPSENLLISGKTEALNSCSSYSTILNQSANEIDLKLANIRLDYSKDSMENHNVKNSKHINSILEDTELEKNEFSHELHNEVLVNKYIAPESLEAISHSSLEPSNVHTYDTNLEISQSLSNDCVVLPDSKTQPDFKTLNEIKSNKKTFKAIKITKPHEPLSKSEDLVIKSTVNSDDLLNSSMNNISSDLISKKNMTSELSSNDLNVPSESSQSTSPSSIFSTSGWGGVFSTFSSIKSGLYDVIDPRLKPEEELELSTEEAPKSPFKVLLDRIQPVSLKPYELLIKCFLSYFINNNYYNTLHLFTFSH